MKFYQKLIYAAASILVVIIICTLYSRQGFYIDKNEWESLVLAQDENADYYERLLIYGIQESVKEKFSDVEFLERFGLFVLKELYGPFNADYKIALDKGNNVLFVFGEKIKFPNEAPGEGRTRSIIIEKKTGRIITISKSRF
jgi:hypothetical protein